MIIIIGWWISRIDFLCTFAMKVINTYKYLHKLLNSKNMRKNYFLTAAAALLALGMQAQTTFTSGQITYTVTGENTVECSGVDNAATSIEIPPTVENGGVTYDVKAIGEGAFKWSNLISVVIPG